MIVVLILFQAITCTFPIDEPADECVIVLIVRYDLVLITHAA